MIDGFTIEDLYNVWRSFNEGSQQMIENKIPVVPDEVDPEEITIYNYTESGLFFGDGFITMYWDGSKNEISACIADSAAPACGIVLPEYEVEKLRNALTKWLERGAS